MSQDFEVHLTSHFQDEYVYVALDDRVVFRGFVTTDHTIGLAGVVHATAERGEHDIKISVGLEEVRETLNFDEYVYVLVSRDGVSQELAIRVTTQSPAYD